MTLPTLRFARDSDAPGLISLIGLCFSEYPGCVLDVDNELPELKAIRSAFDRWRGEFWVLELEQRIVGCVGWTPAQSEPSAIELRKLYIHPELRRQGHGGRLCSMIEEVATRAQMAFVELWSDTRFVQAHQLYESRGYVRGPQRALHDLSNTLEFYYRKAL